jgi:hypothetical protein
VRFFPEKAPWDFDLQNKQAAYNWLENQGKDNNGALLEKEILFIDNTEILKAIFKYPMLIPNSMGMYYLGLLFLSFKDFYYQINIEAAELDPIGLREAVVSMLEGPKIDVTKVEPIQVSSTQELFEKMKQARAQAEVLPSDDEKYDAGFPDHPLTKVRGMQKRICETLKIHKKLLDN